MINMNVLAKPECDLPSVKSMFVPDPGFMIFDADLERADAQVVAAEAGDIGLLERFRSGADVHTLNAQDIFGIKEISKHQRYQAKQGVHATNYGASAWAVAQALKIPKWQAQKFIDSWLGAHPKIKLWQERIEDQLMRTREVQNAFGFKRHYFDRIDNLLKEALAWIPQTTVANVINKGWLNIDRELRNEVQVLLQVHDSLVMQTPRSRYEELKPQIIELMTIEIPYPDPLIIPVNIKESTVSWGDCK